MPRKRVLIQCSSAVDRNAVRRETRDGVEHIIVSSYTLPDDIVMNGGLYPADEIERSFKTLERTLAPVDHPHDADGNFISATDPTAIHNFYAGAFNVNVRRDGNRIALDKTINVQEALKSDRGRRLLDRIEELETNTDARPIHTSTGVFLVAEELDGPKTNAAGQEYTWIARDMVFDHDAILLDKNGAAQPSQGVGMGVNRNGDQLEVHRYELNANELVTVETDPAAEVSFSDVQDALYDAIRQPPYMGGYIVEIFNDRFIFESGEIMFSVPYKMDNGRAQIVGIPVPVERDVAYKPKTNQKGDAMKELMLNALAASGVEVPADISDADLFAKYNELQANQNSGGNGGNSDDNLAEVVANALKPVTEKLASLEAKINQTDEAKRAEFAEIVGNSDKYPGIDVETAKSFEYSLLEKMAANCAPAYGVPLSVVNGGRSDQHTPFDMPK